MLKVILPSKREFTEGDISSLKEIFSLVKEIFLEADCKIVKLLHIDHKRGARLKPAFGLPIQIKCYFVFFLSLTLANCLFY